MLCRNYTKLPVLLILQRPLNLYELGKKFKVLFTLMIDMYKLFEGFKRDLDIMM